MKIGNIIWSLLQQMYAVGYMRAIEELEIGSLKLAPTNSFLVSPHESVNHKVLRI